MIFFYVLVYQLAGSLEFRSIICKSMDEVAEFSKGHHVIDVHTVKFDLEFD